jgi:hypothetical protein
MMASQEAQFFGDGGLLSLADQKARFEGKRKNFS